MFIKFCYPAGSDVRPFLHKSSHKCADSDQRRMRSQSDATDKDSFLISPSYFVLKERLSHCEAGCFDR
jgi:hypothetical protein